EGRLPRKFTVRDMERWKQEEDPRKSNGEPFTKDCATLLSNATVRDPDAPWTPNRNRKFLRWTKAENGERVYELDPAKLW
ncbi:MAG: hypothetical protein P1P84_05390, partial [Deferrisomatales bacterium]|nr:hypothetical protein [Deferrisomatales bacterium]